MGSTELKVVFNNVIRTVAARLSVHGFAQQGRVLTKRRESNVAVIDFQLSDKSSEERLVFTVNLGIICGDAGGASRNADVTDAHLRLRLGSLLPGGGDRWWDITHETKPISLANDLSAALEDYAIPWLDEYLDSRALLALWESGKSPGLTATQRARFLARLRTTL